MTIVINEATGLPRFYPSAYTRNDDILRLIARLAHGAVEDWKVETLAKAVHRATPVAGNPVPWAEDGFIVKGVYWDESKRDHHREVARWALERAVAERGQGER